jgi:NTP pyrophosphatase (non-canonical NTP hydrolase)
MSLENKLAAEIRAYNEGRPTMTPDQFDAEFEVFWKRAGLFEEIAAEREKQDAKWGIQNHDPFKWISILSEEVGEVAKAANDSFWCGENPLVAYDKKKLKDYRAELIQVAAVAVSMIECLDRGKW